MKIVAKDNRGRFSGVFYTSVAYSLRGRFSRAFGDTFNNHPLKSWKRGRFSGVLKATFFNCGLKLKV
jgi:hypothetical protein